MRKNEQFFPMEALKSEGFSNIADYFRSLFEGQKASLISEVVAATN